MSALQILGVVVGLIVLLNVYILVVLFCIWRTPRRPSGIKRSPGVRVRPVGHRDRNVIR